MASRLGVKLTAVTGLILMAVATLAFGLADSAWVLVFLRFLGGVGSALSWVAAFTWLVRRAPEERRGELIGVMLSAAVFGALLGPVLGSIAATVGIFPAFTVVATVGVLIAVWAAVEPAPDVIERQSLIGSLHTIWQPQLLIGLWFITLSPLIFAAVAVLVPLELNSLGWGAAAVGAVFLTSAAFESAVHPLLGRWSDRVGYRLPILVGLTASISILIVLSLASGPWLLAALVVLATGAFNATLVPGTALFSRGTERAGLDQAIAFAVTNFAWASGYAVGAPLGGALADVGGDALSYLVLTVFCVLTLLLLRRVK